MKSSDTTQNSPGNSKENVQTRSQDNPLGYEKESKLLVGFAIPCIISMLVTALYNIVDQIFIGHKFFSTSSFAAKGPGRTPAPR